MSVPAYPEYKDSGVAWLGEVPGHWELTRVGAKFWERREKVSDTDYPALSVTKKGIVPQLDTAAKTDDNDNRKCVLAGDFVINSRSDRNGSSGLSELDGSVSLINTVIRAYDGMDGRFIHHLFRSVPFQQEYYRFGKGIVADLWSTNYGEMKAISLAVPTVAEQQAIAAFLDRETAKIDRLVAEQERLIALLKEKRQAVISHAVTKGLNPDAPLKDSGIEWLGEIPAHWELTTIGRVCSQLSYGFTNPMPTSDDGPYMLTANDIGDREIRYDTARRTELEAFEDLLTGKSRPLSGDVLVTKDGTLGRVAVFDGQPACINQSVAFLRPNANVSSNFLANALSDGIYQNRMIYEAGGTTIKHIYISRLAKMPFAIPPKDEIPEIEAFCEAKLAQATSLQQTAQLATTLLQERRAALISAAVTGKIDVRALVDAPADREFA